MTWISGNTYVNRHIIKPMGFTWNKTAKVWERTLPLTPDEESALNDLKGIIVDSARDGIIIDNRKDSKPMTFKQMYGRCEDAPCCGCCGDNYYTRGY